MYEYLDYKDDHYLLSVSVYNDSVYNDSVYNDSVYKNIKSLKNINVCEHYEFYNITFFFYKNIYTISKLKKHSITLNKKKKRKNKNKTETFMLITTFESFLLDLFENFKKTVILSILDKNNTKLLSVSIFSYNIYLLLLFLPDNYIHLFFENFFFKKYSVFAEKFTNFFPNVNMLKIGGYFKSLNKNSFQNKFDLYLWFVLRISEKKLQKKFLFRVVNLNSCFFKKKKVKKLIESLYFRFKIYDFLIGKNFIFSEIFEVVWLSIFYKDPILFNNWINWTLMHIQYKSMRKFLHFLKIFLVQYMLPALSNETRVLGFFFDIRGKVGVTGDAKKRHTSIMWGQSSYTTKNLRFTLKQNIVKTRTGALGITTVITF